MNYSQLNSRDEDALFARIEGENDALTLETPNSDDHYYLTGWHNTKTRIVNGELDKANLESESKKSIDFGTLQVAVTYLYWNLDFYEFCQQILQKDDWTEERIENDYYCLEKWDKWRDLNRALHLFDCETLKCIIAVHERRQRNK